MKTTTTTIRLPQAVYEQAKSLVERRKSSETVSLNDLFVAAIKSYLRAQRRLEIDAAFAGMAEDSAYQQESMSLQQDFANSDWEALQLGDS